MATTTTAERRSERRTLVQTAALVFGVVFLLVGIAGFIPGITEDAPGDFAGEDSPGSLLGVFQVGILHSLVHALFGVLGILMARTAASARTYLLVGGAVYAVLFLVGLLGAMDWLPADDTDDWLHAGLAAAMLGAAFLTGRERRDVVVDRRDDRLAA
jgi:hypothetical protein